VHDVLTVVSHAKNHDDKPEKIYLIGLGKIGPVAAAAAAQCDDALAGLAIGSLDFRFEKVTDYLDPAFVPGIVKYGDLPALIVRAAPPKLLLIGEVRDVPELVMGVYKAKQGNLAVYVGKEPSKHIVQWLK